MIDLAAMHKSVSESLVQAQQVAGAAADVVKQHQTLITEIEAAMAAVPSVADVKAMIAKLPG